MLDAGGEYRVMLDVPGAVKDDLEVVAGPVRGTLSVRARGKEPGEPPAGQPLVSERAPRPGAAVRYARVIPVGWDADMSKAKTNLADGVLTVVIPKAVPGDEKKRS